MPEAVTVSAWVRRSGTPGNFKYILGKGALGCHRQQCPHRVNERRAQDLGSGAERRRGDRRHAVRLQGLLAPVDNAVAKAGSAVPVKFSLTGDQGMSILAAGSPGSQPTSCTSTANLDTVEETAANSNGGLAYDATSDRYQYVWKTDKAWAGTCRQFVLRLTDGSAHTASFRFAK